MTVTLTMEEYKKPDDKVDLMMAFKVFDCNNKGYIDTKELRRAFMRLKELLEKNLRNFWRLQILKKIGTYTAGLAFNCLNVKSDKYS